MQTKDKRSSFSHTKDVGERLKDAATQQGVSVSTYIDQAVAERLERDRRMTIWRDIVGYNLDDAPADTLARVRAMFDSIEESNR